MPQPRVRLCTARGLAIVAHPPRAVWGRDALAEHDEEPLVDMATLTFSEADVLG